MTESVFETFDETRKAYMQKRRDLLVELERVVTSFHCEFLYDVRTKPMANDKGNIYIEGFGVGKIGGVWRMYAKISLGGVVFIDAAKGQAKCINVRGGMVLRSLLEHIEGFLGAIKPSLELHLADEEVLISRAEQSLTGFVTRNSLEDTENDY